MSQLASTIKRSDWPLWVQVGLLGSPSRTVAQAFLWLSIVLIAASLVAAVLIRPAYLVGFAFYISATWYYLAIRWVDEHDGWLQAEHDSAN